MPYGNNPLTGRPGPAPKPPRSGDKKQARQRINVEVRTGRRPHPSKIPCADCGHIGADRRHEYDHYLGYDADHHYDVEAVCSVCHHLREPNHIGRDRREDGTFARKEGSQSNGR